ncbi:hypothetical protein LTR86_000356 [Recurvomyces mirabilis]|nr:hypothetical protein LTR86_000356 [Recurvomyces mirabilis]
MSPLPSVQTAVAKRKTDVALMPPPPLPKRQKRPAKVLDEDVYSDALSHIIARDYFPGLLESEAQQEYLTALDSNNNDWIRDAGRKLTQVMTPGPDGRRRGTSFTPRRSTAAGDTPRGYVGSTPARTPMTERGADHFAAEQEPEVDVNMSLGAFQAKYTSEDNESFNALLDKQNVKRAVKAREQKLVENGTTSTSLITTNAAGEERQAVAHARPSQDLDTRPASVDSFPNRQGPRNHFMFGPDGVEDYTITAAEDRQANSLAPPKTVTHTATRLPSEADPANIPRIPASPSLSAIDAAISGRPKPTDSEPGYSGVETPRVNGYAFVDAEPSPSELGVPVTDEEADAAEREEVMKLLPKADGDGGRNPFSLSEKSAREELHLRLVEKADTARRKGGTAGGGGGGRLGQLRELGITPGRTPTPRFSSAPKTPGRGLGVGGSTPAGRVLAARLGMTPRKAADGNGGGGGKGLGERWDGTPKIKRVV